MPIVAGTQVTGDGFEAQLLGRHAEVTGAAERFGIESVLKLMLATALLPRSALLVHSVALGDGTSCAVLLGESGSGKSTLGAVGAFAGLRRLADELVVLDGAGRAHGTPWNTGVPEIAKLVLFGTFGWGAASRSARANSCRCCCRTRCCPTTCRPALPPSFKSHRARRSRTRPSALLSS